MNLGSLFRRKGEKQPPKLESPDLRETISRTIYESRNPLVEEYLGGYEGMADSFKKCLLRIKSAIDHHQIFEHLGNGLNVENVQDLAQILDLFRSVDEYRADRDLRDLMDDVIKSLYKLGGSLAELPEVQVTLKQVRNLLPKEAIWRKDEAERKFIDALIAFIEDNGPLEIGMDEATAALAPLITKRSGNFLEDVMQAYENLVTVLKRKYSTRFPPFPYIIRKTSEAFHPVT